MKVVIDDCRLERMDVYTDPLNDKIKRQAAEITRLLAENAELKGLNSTICDVCKNDEFLKETAEQARAEGQEEAWKLALKLRYMDYEDKVECFGLGYDGKEKWIEVMENYTYAEAAAKVAEWERKKEEICVGDVLLSNSIREKCVVTANCNGIFTLLWKDGSSGNHGEKAVREYEKVGHIDVNEFLKKIGDER